MLSSIRLDVRCRGKYDTGIDTGTGGWAGEGMSALTEPPRPTGSESNPANPRVPTRSRRLPEEASIAVALVTLTLLLGWRRPLFIKPDNLINLATSSAFWGFLALGMVLLLVIREIDLSVGWAFNFSAVICAQLIVSGINPFVAALASVAFGAALGAMNGAISVLMRVPVLIVTLGTFSIFQGLSLVVNDSKAVVPTPETREGAYFGFVRYELFGRIPVILIFLITVAIGLHLLLHRTRFGYRVLAFGSNPQAAILAGLQIRRITILVTAIVGALAGLSAALFVGFRGAVDPNTGADYLLIVVAATIIGGTPLSGGSGTVIGALLGVFLIAVINSGIIFLGVEATWSSFVTGVVILLAVGIDRVIRARRSSSGLEVKDGF